MSNKFDFNKSNIVQEALDRAGAENDIEGMVSLLKKYFGGDTPEEMFVKTQSLATTGMRVVYESLAEEVKREKKILLILLGLKDIYSDVEINTYVDPNWKRIPLTIGGLCYHLIKDYIKPENVEGLCGELLN